MGLKREPGRRESVFWGPAEVSGGSFRSQNRFQTGSTHTKSFVALPLPPAPSFFVGRDLVGRRNALVLGWSRGCVHRSSLIVHRSSVIGHRSEEYREGVNNWPPAPSPQPPSPFCATGPEPWVFDRIQPIRCSPLDRAHFLVPGRRLRPPEVSRDRPRAVMGGSGTENGARIGLNFG